MKKTLTLTFIAIIAIVLTYALIYMVGMQGFSFAFSLNFLLMACALSFTEALKNDLNYAYFKVKRWEQNGKVYESVGINLYRRLLVVLGWEKLNKKSKPVKKDINALLFLYGKTKQDELGHIIVFTIVLGFTIFVALNFGFMNTLWLLVLNILMNLYPILLQRYNRPRIERAINIAKHRVEVLAYRQ